MKPLLFAAAALLLFCGCQHSAPAPQPELTVTAASRYQILLPDLPQDSSVRKYLQEGAEMLQKALKAGLNMQVPIRPESKALPDMKAICIGDTRKAREAGINAKDHSDFGFTIAEKEGNIFIAGADMPRFGTPDRKKHWGYMLLGSVNGCVKFAEKYLNTRFLYPGENGIDYAELKSVKLPAGLREKVTPKLIFTTRSPGMLYSYANNAYGYGNFRSYGGHSYYSAVPAQKYGKSHPQYFAMQKKKRRSVYNHLCISNPEVQELIYQEMVKWVKKGARAVQLAQTDGYRPCECDKCKAFGNTDNEGEKLWILHRQLAERLYKEYPGHFAHIISYGPTKEPPKSFKEFPPNVIIELCTYTQETFDKWKNHRVEGGFTTYVYNWGSYNRMGFLPKRTPGFCADQVRLFMKNNVRGVYRCGFGENFGLEGPAYYVYGQMFNDCTQSEALLTDEFLRRAFHESYVPMKTFFDTLFARLAIYPALHLQRAIPKDPGVLITAVLSPDMIDILSRALAQAEKMAKTPKVKARLELVRVEFDYARNLAETLHLYNAYRINPTKSSLAPLVRSIEKRNALIKSFIDPKRPSTTRNYSKNWDLPIFNAPPIQQIRANGRLNAVIKAPLNWNTKKLKAQKDLPQAGKKR